MENIVILEKNELAQYNSIDDDETVMMQKAGELLKLNYPEHSLLEIWNSGIHNLRRRVEAYSIDMFLSNISNLSGKKNYKRDGDTLAERWSGVDDEILIKGASQLGVINKKAAKALEMIEWMRNHASPSHNNDESVTEEDVLGLVVIIKKNLFELAMPDPAHSPVGLIDPIKSNMLDKSQIELFKQQINSFKKKDIRMLFGFGLDAICSGKEPAYGNIKNIFPSIWDRATEDLKTGMGMRFHNYMFDPSNDSSNDLDAKSRVYEMLIEVEGVKYIPDATRAVVFRKLARNLSDAKNAIYGWNQEVRAAKALRQAGVCVPSIAFEEVYQEILSVYCGNYWGRSEAHNELQEFIFGVSTQERLKIARLFLNNQRVRDELFQDKPKRAAITLLKNIRESFTVESHIAEVEQIIENVEEI